MTAPGTGASDRSARKLRVWIDLANSPHPLLFEPVARQLGALGHQILATARDNAQTVELTRERWPAATVIGGPSPRGRRRKAAALGSRVLALRRWAQGVRPDVALSHNSYAQLVAARRLGIPAVTAMDYEHQPANHLAFRLAHTVLLPLALVGSHARRQGATPRKTRFYPGLKEELYLAEFRPAEDLVERLGINPAAGERLVVARPEPAGATYHRFSNPLFTDCLRAVLRDPDVRVVVLARNPDQRREIAELGLARCQLPASAIDSRSLLAGADLMLGAGGTMTREAALMGVPTISLFAGRRPAVDCWLESRGLLRSIRSAGELPAVRQRPRAASLELLRERGRRLVNDFCAAVAAAGGSASR